MLRSWIALNILSEKLEYDEAQSYCVARSKGYYFTCMAESIDKIPSMSNKKTKDILDNFILAGEIQLQKQGIYFIPSRVLHPITYVLQPSIIGFSRYLIKEYHKFVSMSLMSIFDEIMIEHKSLAKIEYYSLISLDDRFAMNGFLQFHEDKSGTYVLNVLARHSNSNGLGKLLMNMMYDKIFEFPRNADKDTITITLKTLAGSIADDLQRYYIHQGYTCDEMDYHGSYLCNKIVYRKKQG